ncbi:MAG: HIT family protein [Alphaproteobacteria bacterium]|nr:HIT family protein [Alphaproteobacteria bacterium]
MTLDPRLTSNSSFVTDLELCHMRLHHNAGFPWFLLIPKIENISEIIDLTPADQGLLMKEIALTSQAVRHVFQPKKLNVASLGNIVPQLHIHVVARYENDGAWPGPIWNSGISKDYEDKIKTQIIEEMKDTLFALMKGIQ